MLIQPSMLMSPEQNHNIKIGNKSFETVEQFKYLGSTKQIKMLFTNKCRGYWTRGMLVVSRCSLSYFSLLSKQYRDNNNNNIGKCNLLTGWGNVNLSKTTSSVWLVCCLVGWLSDWVDGLVTGRLVGWLVKWLGGWFSDRSVGRLVG
jgi:hypothetical protein